jgi:hypothetical protein
MSDLRLPYAGLDFESEYSTAQFVIPAGAGATFAASNNICTFTSNAAHGLTLNPAAGVMPNYYVTFGGSSSGITGTGVLINNIFRILSIPSTTTFTFYSTITAATVTSTTVIPVFFPNFTPGYGSGFSGGPTQTISTVVTPFPVQQLTGGLIVANLGANCNVQYNPNQTAVLLDAMTTPSTGTPATAPNWRVCLAASTSGNWWGAAPSVAVFANGTTATSYFSVVN